MKEKLPFSFRVLLLGEGSMRKELEVLAEQMGLSDTVVFLGNISNEDVKQYLYASELFLFASKSETQGIVLEEAMAAGNPNPIVPSPPLVTTLRVCLYLK